MRNWKYAAVAALVFGPALAFAGSYITQRGDTLATVASRAHMTLAELALANPNLQVRGDQTVAYTVPMPVPVPPPTIPTPPPPTGSESRFSAYTTGYGWPDNTPMGSADISDPVLHQSAGGSGTFTDPITLAVGHSISNGKDTLDYPAGTKFYIPNLRKYFIVEDTCGDGNSPQNGPCHTGYQGHVWLDLWVGGNSSNQSATLACEDNITDVHLVIQNPAATYAVVAGDVASGCKQFGDTIQ